MLCSLLPPSTKALLALTPIARVGRSECIPLVRKSISDSISVSRRYSLFRVGASSLNVTANGPTTPLSERPPIHECGLSDLLTWHKQAIKSCFDVGNSFATSTGGGPTAEELVRELNWLLDDSVAAVQLERQQWLDSSWASLRTVSNPSATVRLRASLVEELIPMWHSRLQDRVPFQYLVATAHWRDLVLAVQPGVLIPRPETEQLVDIAALCCKSFPSLPSHTWLDLGCGSGALGIALSSSLGVSVVAVDRSSVAVSVARYNTARCRAQALVSVLEGSWYDPVPQGLMGCVGGIVSNPPYIPREDLAGLQVEVGSHEPHEALDGGPGDGTDAVREIARGAQAWLVPGGVLILETNGGSQAHWVASFLAGKQGGEFIKVSVEKDLFGVDRHVVAYKRS